MSSFRDVFRFYKSTLHFFTLVDVIQFVTLQNLFRSSRLKTYLLNRCESMLLVTDRLLHKINLSTEWSSTDI